MGRVGPAPGRQFVAASFPILQEDEHGDTKVRRGRAGRRHYQACRGVGGAGAGGGVEGLWPRPPQRLPAVAGLVTAWSYGPPRRGSRRSRGPQGGAPTGVRQGP